MIIALPSPIRAIMRNLIPISRKVSSNLVISALTVSSTAYSLSADPSEHSEPSCSSSPSSYSSVPYCDPGLDPSPWLELFAGARCLLVRKGSVSAIGTTGLAVAIAQVPRKWFTNSIISLPERAVMGHINRILRVVRVCTKDLAGQARDLGRV